MVKDKSLEGMDDLISDFNRFYILTLLYKGPIHGYSIIIQFKCRIGKEISPSLVYPFLQQLEEKGYVKHTAELVEDKKRKNFELTKTGKECCTTLFKRFTELVSTAIESSIYACDHCNCKIYESAYRETIDCIEMTFCCIHCAQSYKQSKTINM
ncbi:MAG: PadR family transcriptional regulator [Nitrososphaerota archaeon]|jgi:DNA-binding PadR family transcriptional regulator|nr:PadR family transcriptional regulator [Nitrososphaerota archaeon]